MCCVQVGLNRACVGMCVKGTAVRCLRHYGVYGAAGAVDSSSGMVGVVAPPAAAVPTVK